MIRTYLTFIILVFALIPCFSVRSAVAQFGSVKGIVFDKDLRDELPGATIILDNMSGEKKFVVTGKDGLFAFHRVFPDVYTVSVSFIGFTTFVDTFTIALGAQLYLEVRLVPSETEMEEVVVDAVRTDNDQFVAGLDSILPEDLTRIPMPDVTYDLAGYLLTLPGFVSPGDRGGQLFVRGGTPTQNLVLLDGMNIFQPFHIIGFFSAFPADIVAYTDVYAGGFGARYGGRISSVIDITTRNGSKQKAKGAVSIAPFMTTLRIEAPIIKNEASILVSLRQSVIENVAPTLVGEEIPFKFGDLFAKFHAFLNQTSSFTATVLRTTDQGNISSGVAFDKTRRLSTWENEAYGAKFLHIPDDFPAMLSFGVNYSKLTSKYTISPDNIRKSSVDQISLEMSFNYLLGNNKVHMGVFGNLNEFNYKLGRSPKVRSSVSSGGGYIDMQFIPSEVLRIEPGVRVESFSHGVSRRVAPRIRAVIQPLGRSGKHQFSLAVGRYYQQIIGLSNEQDVSDVFTVWAASPQSRPVPSSSHYLAGWRGRFFPWLELSLEGYLKNMQNIAFPVFSNQILGQPDFARVSGEARGADLKVEIQFPDYFFAASYTLAKVEYSGNKTARFGEAVISDDRFFPPHDRRHQINLMGQIIRGRGKFIIRWQFGSGLPFTQVNGYFESDRLKGPDDRSHLTGNGFNFVSRSTLYGARLPSYHRLDVSYEYRIRRGDVATTLQIGAINVYDKENIFEYNIFDGNRINQLPFTPSFAVKVEVL